MSDPIISLFIDDELDLNGKIELVENIYSTPSFKDETIGFLNQEKLIRSDVVDCAPAISFLALSPGHPGPFGCRSCGDYFDVPFYPCQT
jgi:hypothetical protein